jgi:hypothetical protein
LTLLLAVGVALCRRTSVIDQATAYSLAICATLVVSPLSWGHYYMAFVPAAFCVPVWLLGRGMESLARVAAVVPPMLSWTYYVGMPYTGALGILGLGTTAWFLGACGLILGIEVAGALGASRSTSRGNRPMASEYRPLGIGGRRTHVRHREAARDSSALS